MKRYLFALMILISPVLGLAHGYWLEVTGPGKVNESVTVRLYFGEYVTGERLSGSFLDRMKEIKVYVHKEPIIMKQLNDYWEGQFTPSSEGTYFITAINDEREVQDWTKHQLGIVRPVQYLKTVYQVGAKVSPASMNQLLDAVITKDKDSIYTITATKNNAPLAEAKITVTHPDGEETYLNGHKTQFTAPKPGLYIIDIEWTDKTSGQFKGKDYTSIRYKLDYSLYH